MEKSESESDDEMEQPPRQNHTVGDEKRRKLTRDRLTELPDLPLVHILSYLHTEEAAKTIVLSKRFNSLFNSLDSLIFSDEYSAKEGDSFIDFVDSALGFHRREFVRKFSLTLEYKFSFKKAVDRWMEIVALKQVKSLYLNLNPKHTRKVHRLAEYMYKFPDILCENEKLEELVMFFCDFSVIENINCRRLTFLSITQSRVTEVSISHILSGCTALETLELRRCVGYDKLMISSSSLRTLRVDGEQLPFFWPIAGQHRVLEISGPRLVSLEVRGTLYRTKLRLTDLGNLVSAVMVFTIKPPGSSSKASKVVEEEVVRDVLESLCLVKAVTIGGSIMQGLWKRKDYNLSSPWSDRRSLTLCIPVAKWNQLQITSLLRSSPFLESLFLKLSYCSDTCVLEHIKSSDQKYYWKSWSTISKCPLLHLKKVKVVGFQVSCQSMKPIFEFLEFLLRNSKVLQEVVVHASRYVTRAALDESMKLLDVPTASPDVVVQFEPPRFWLDPLYMYKELVPLFFT